VETLSILSPDIAKPFFGRVCWKPVKGDCRRGVRQELADGVFLLSFPPPFPVPPSLVSLNLFLPFPYPHLPNK